MPERVRLRRHPHLVAIGLVTALLAALLVTVPLAAPADASALAVNITRLYDGTAPFEDWSPGDTTTPTPNGSHDPGDDLDGNNGIVRTLDDVRYRVEYSVNPPLPSGDLVLEVELGNAAWKDGWVPGSSTCPNGSSFSADRSLWTCNLGVVTGASGTVAIDIPAVPPTSAADGSQIQAQVRLTEDADPTTTRTANAAVTTVSAAPRYEVTKQRIGDATVTANSLGTIGLAARYFVGLHAADADPRGLSAITDPLTVTDNFGVPGAELTCYNGLYSALPFHNTKTPANPDRAVSTAYSTCAQTGDALDITWDINWDRAAPPPTQGSYSSLYSYAQNLVAYDLVSAWLPITTVDAADGTPGDGQGQIYAPNSIETSIGGVAAPGTCSTYTWSPDAGSASRFDPDDTAGQNNLGAGVEPFADNGGCARYFLNINTYGSKSGPTDGSSVIPSQDFPMTQYIYNTSSTGPALPDRVVCDKFDNSRFTLNAAPVFGSTSGTRYAPTTSSIEYGIGLWGESYPGGAKTNDANAWYVQATSNCSDSTAQDLGGGVLWVDGAGVDWTNSGGGTVDADQINMVRATVNDSIPAGQYVQVTYDFHARDDLTDLEELRNYSAFVVNPASTWTTSTCTGQNNAAQTCTADLDPPAYGGAYSRWLQVTDSVARVSKSALGTTTLNAGDTNSWRVYAWSYPSSTYPPGGWGGWTGSTDIVLDDILPESFGYVLGSARAWNNTGTPVPIADPTIIPDTPSAGLTTLRWDLGAVPWNTYRRVEFDTKVEVYADTGSYTNYAEVHTASDANVPFPAFPNGDTFGRRASAAVDVVALSSAVISKTSTTPYIVPGQDTVYTLQFGNPGPDDIEWMDAIDILPYEGDTRGSIITADTFTLADVSTAVGNVETWVSDTDPATLSALDGFHDDVLWPADPGVTAPGTPQWPCTFTDAQAGVPGCPALADVTALRFIGSDPNPGASGPGDSFVAAGQGPFDITITYNTTVDALPGDTYPNSWMAVFEGLSLPVLSPSDISPTIPRLGVGDLVYIDVDFNGVYDAAHDLPVPGVDVELYAEGAIQGTDAPVGTATTDAAGRWFIGDLSNGNYWAWFPSSNTDPGGPLEGRSPALGSVADPNTDADETTDHNTVNLNGIASGLISLAIGGEPIGDGVVPPGYRDVDVNGTLDFAARGGPVIDVQKTVYTGHDGGAGCSGGEAVTVTSGADVTWCVSVTNTGDTHLAAITLDDTDLGITTGDFTLLSGTPALLAPGANATWFVETNPTATLDNDVDATGNPATAGGTDIASLSDVTATDNATVNVVAPAITIDKTVYAGHDTGASCDGGELVSTLAGADVTYCFTVTNTGDTHLADIGVDDTDLSIDQTAMTLRSGDPTLVAPGGTVTWSYDTTATTDLTNTATTTGNPATAGGADLVGLTDVTDSDTARVDEVAPAITIDKTVYAGHDTGASCDGNELVTALSGDDITYCFTVTNTGDTHLADIGVDDTDLSIDQTAMTLRSGDPTLVAPGGTVTWSYDTTTTTDLTNTATTTATPATPAGTDLTGIANVNDSDTAQVDVVAPDITIDKTVYAGHDTGASCTGDELVWYTTTDDELTYCFEITNTGDTHLSITTIDDTDLGIDGNDLTLLSGNPILLAPGATTIGYYQTNGTGDLLNTVNLAANPIASDGTDLTGLADVTDTDTARVDEVAPAITIDKTVYAGHDAGASCDGDELVTALSGDDITYCFTITNTGDTHLDTLSISDLDLGIDQSSMTLRSGTPTLVAPGDTVTWSYDTTTTTDLTNTASASGNPTTPGGTDMTGIANVNDSDTAAVDVVAPAVTIDKTVYAGHDTGASCTGDELVWYTTADTAITYCFTITNTGDTHLTDASLDDTTLGIDEADLTLLSGNLALLAPGASVTGFYETNGSGDLLNIATATGDPAASDGTDHAALADVTDTDTASVDEVAPDISIQTTVYAGHDSGAGCTGVENLTTAAGHPVTYCYAVTNTGDTHLALVTVDDPDLGIDHTAMTLVGGNSFLLAPGATATWMYETTNTAALTNTAATTGDPAMPDGTDMTGIADVTDSDPATTAISATAVSIVKTVTTGTACPGVDLLAVAPATDVTYCFAVTNTGIADLADVTIDDPDLSIDQDDMAVVSGDLTLLPAGDTAVLSYRTTTSGDLLNTAAATGDPVDGSGTPIAGLTPPTATDDAEVTELATGITVEKTVYVGHDDGARCDGSESVTGVAGTRISYCFTVTNTGSAHLSDVTVTDNNLRIDDSDMTVVSGDLTRLAPGASATLVHETTLGRDLVNTARATGSPTDGSGTAVAGLTPPSDTDTARVDRIDPSIDIKQRAITPIVPVGYTAEYELTVTNTGDVALRNVRVSDPRMPACARTIGALAVGAKVTYTCEGPIGSTPTILVSVARATADVAGACSADPCVTDEDDAEIEVVESVLVLEKRALQNEVAQGGIATYSFTITNPTRLTIEDVRLIDETFPECSREIGTLGALQTVSYTCDVTTPEQAGELVNKAYVSGTMLTRSYTYSASAAIMIITTIPGAPLSGPLAATGASSSSASTIAALLLAMGFLFLATGRSRRRETVVDDQG